MKKIMVKNGSYKAKDGTTKNRYTQVGVIMQGDNGEFALLDPTINLAGFDRQGKDRVMAGIFEDDREPVQKQEKVSEEELENIPFN